VDVHALTTVETTQDLQQNTTEMVLDWLAAGIRPDETIVFVQSHVPEVMELHTYLSMVTQFGKLTDLPTQRQGEAAAGKRELWAVGLSRFDDSGHRAV
jgi:tryptophanyl-tRNA synthetase